MLMVGPTVVLRSVMYIANIMLVYLQYIALTTDCKQQQEKNSPVMDKFIIAIDILYSKQGLSS